MGSPFNRWARGEANAVVTAGPERGTGEMPYDPGVWELKTQAPCRWALRPASAEKERIQVNARVEFTAAMTLP